ncbi:exosortase V [Sphingomonas arenae]|uniref:exosortase V n=1 Tax=Sphingomonas arenae TaxID=2812555 RepID=UPI001967720C|nr:exosortase V [Sphingomonas arenae]
MLLVKDPPRKILPRLSTADIVFLLGCAILIVPTLIGVARFSWTTEQGGHGPIVLATGIWLLLREIKDAKVERAMPSPWLPAIGIAFFLSVFLIARITGILEIEAMAMYGALLLGIYLLVGGAFMRAIWFPLVYLALVLPPPDTVVAAVTQPIKIAISEWAVALLHGLGYPIASSGVNIYIAQFELLVAAACAGLNSIISLGAICLFYVYLRHRNNFVAFLLVSLAVIPVAIFSNFVRVIVLILITYYLGEAAAQGFLHDFAGLLMFSVALVTIFALDSLYGRIAARRHRPVPLEAAA